MKPFIGKKTAEKDVVGQIGELEGLKRFLREVVGMGEQEPGVCSNQEEVVSVLRGSEKVARQSLEQMQMLRLSLILQGKEECGSGRFFVSEDYTRHLEELEDAIMGFEEDQQLLPQASVALRCLKATQSYYLFLNKLTDQKGAVSADFLGIFDPLFHLMVETSSIQTDLSLILDNFCRVFRQIEEEIDLGSHEGGWVNPVIGFLLDFANLMRLIVHSGATIPLLRLSFNMLDADKTLKIDHSTILSFTFEIRDHQHEYLTDENSLRLAVEEEAEIQDLLQYLLESLFELQIGLNIRLPSDSSFFSPRSLVTSTMEFEELSPDLDFG